MTISYQNALTWLEQNPNATVAEIRNLVSQVSTEVPNAKVTILYSGKIGDLNAYQIAESIGANTEGAATIGQTDAWKLLNDPNLRSSLQFAALKEGLSFDEILDGKDSTGARITNDSFWDIASNNFASNATGEVKTITMNADGLSVFSQTEVPALLNNPNVTKINGVDVADLKSIYETKGFYGFSQAIKESSAANAYDLKTGISEGQLVVASKEFLKDVDGISGVDLPPNSTDIKFGTHLLAIDAEWKAFTALSDSVFNKATLSKLGVAGDLLSVSFAVNQANAALESGDSDLAKDIMGKWAAEFLGGTAGAVAAVAVVTPLIGVLAPGAVVAGTITLAIGMVGGVLGGEAGEYLYEKAKELGAYLDSDLEDFQNSLTDYLNDLFGDAQVVSDALSGGYQSFVNAVLSAVARDPLIVDVDGDGLSLSSWQSSGVKFDMDGNGTSESTGWTVPSNSNYEYSKGSGSIIIDQANANLIDRIVFGSGISKDSVTFSKVGVWDSSVPNTTFHYDLVITFNDSNNPNDKITILNYFRSPEYVWENGVGTSVDVARFSNLPSCI